MSSDNIKSSNEAATVEIRTTFLPGDIDKIILLHRKIYSEEYAYGSGFNGHVIKGLQEFYQQYDQERDRIWICESGVEFAGSLVSMHRGDDVAQLRFFVLKPAFRSRGIGNKLMQLFIGFMNDRGYRKAYLWTTSELLAAAALYRKYGFHLTEEKASSAFGKEVIEQRYDLVL